MSSYKVRSRDLVDVFNDIKSCALIMAPYFQRKLVWRLAHKIDFIKTILLGYPFPEIFVSRGTLDVVSMRSTSCIVDGQQRMNAIKEFIEGEFEVDGTMYADLPSIKKENFLKYEIAIIDLDLSNDDPDLIEIFKRLNRTFYALSNIEKLSAEYGSSEFMLVAKLCCGELRRDSGTRKNVDPTLHNEDPNITELFTEWANSQKNDEYMKFILETPIFSKYEISRQVHLMFTLNIMATFLDGVYARNEQVTPNLDAYADCFDRREEIMERMRFASSYFNRLRLTSASNWFSKSNAFSLLIAIDHNANVLRDIPIKRLKEQLLEFETEMPDDYALAAREAVNNKKQRILRKAYLDKLVQSIMS